LLGLDGVKLERLAAGWCPKAVELGRWRDLRCFTTGGGGFTVNCYLVWDEATRDGALFDTGLDVAPVLEAIKAESVDLRYLFLTHGHSDHVAGVGEIRERFPGVRVRSNLKDAALHERNRAGDCLAVGGLRVTLRETPGHSQDGVTYLVGNWPDDAPGVAVVGDALFAGSMGKAPGALMLARQRVREAILMLPPETLVCPGHGPLTTVGEERAANPFF
jgi:glyoxylase-like metal-dependent hydrolase (beta-lactamase superfamily II)